MPLRQNPHVLKLLSWHGHDSGGVQIPFRRSSPVGQTIETTLIQNLRSLAKSIADGTTEQRWIFLVGGPGNGKSETVQDFLTALDNNLGMQGQLCSLLAEKFRPNPIAPRKVVVESDEVVSAPGNFGDRAGRLVVVQDATATDEAMGNAAKELVKDISSLLNPVESVKPIFVACANRGILARALTEARRQGATMNNVTEFIVKVIRATSIGYDASFIRQDRLSCWPLTSYSQVVCWPLDMESLLTTPVSIRGGTRPSPAEQVFTAAIKESEWEVCADCNSKPLCPFWQNVEWLREPAIRGNYSKVLRHGELYTGQRWNFRDLFSLAAETVIGQWSDFPGKDHPCDWVHERVNQLETSPHRFQRVAPALLLLRRLYPHALFPRVYAQVDLNDTTVNWARHSISEAVFNRAFDIDESSLKPIREILVEDYADLDPAIFTPTT